MNMAFVLLAEPKLPQPEAVIASHRAIAPLGPALVAEIPPDGGTASFRMANGDAVVLRLMSVPVPDGAAAANAEHSLSAMGTGWTLPEHRAHVVVVMIDAEKRPPFARLTAFAHRVLRNEKTRSALDRLIAFTRVVAAVAAAGEAVGVYLGRANATHAPRFFIDIASAEDPLPSMLMVWNGVSIAKEGDRISVLSLGMSQFELPNLLLTAPAVAATDALERMFDLLAYVTSRGAALPAGDTVGSTADERITVRYEPSPIDDAAQVWRVDL